MDAEGVPRAAARAAELLAQLGGGAVLDAVVDRYPHPVMPRTARLPMAHLQRLSGLPIQAPEAAGELRKISDQVQVEGSRAVGHPGASRCRATGPTWRCPRIWSRRSCASAAATSRRRTSSACWPTPARSPAPNRLATAPATAGRRRAVRGGDAGASSPGRRWQRLGDPPLAEGVTVKNPISADYEVMRTSLLPGLAAALARNNSRGIADVRLFEVGPVVPEGHAGPSPSSVELVALLLAGRAAGWLKPGEPLDFFDLKRVVVDLLAGFGVEAEFTATGAIPYLHPGVAAALSLPGGKRLGVAGELHPAAARRLGLEVRALYAELDLEALAAGRAPSRSVPPPRFPASTRDLSFWVDEAVPAAAQRGGLPGRQRAPVEGCGGSGGLPRPALRPRRQEGHAVDHDVSR